MLARITPSQNLTRSYFNSFDRIFDDVLSNWSIFDRIPKSVLESSSLSFEEIDGKLKCEIEMPGFKPSDVQVHAEDNFITIAGKARGKEFNQKLIVNDRYDLSSATATMDAGVLTLTLLPKLAQESKAIPINVVANE